MEILGLISSVDYKRFNFSVTHVINNTNNIITDETQDGIFKLPEAPTTILTDPLLPTIIVGQAVETVRFPGVNKLAVDGIG